MKQFNAVEFQKLRHVNEFEVILDYFVSLKLGTE